MHTIVRWLVSVSARCPTLLLVSGLGLTLAVLLLAGVPLLTPATEYSALDLQRDCDALQEALDREWPHREAYVLAWTDRSAAGPEGECVASSLAKELKRHLRHASHADKELRRLTEATVAVAELRYDAALQLVNEREASAQSTAGTYRIVGLRGDAYFGLGEWQQALDCYRHLGNELLPTTKVSVCLAHLVDEGRHDLADDLAASLNRLGLQLAAHGWFNDALTVYMQAISLWTQIEREHPHPEASIQLAGTLNNYGLALWHDERHAWAIVQFDRAIELQARLVENDVDGRVSRHLADTLCNRGTAFKDLQEPTRALNDFDRSITILENLVAKGDDALLTSLITALNNRAWTQHELGWHAAAIEDLNMAIAARSRIASPSGSPVAIHVIVKTLVNRATIKRRTGNAAGAIEDVDEALAILPAAGGQHEHPLHGACHAARGAAWQDLGDLHEAVAELRQSVSWFEEYLRQFPDPTIQEQLAEVYNRMAIIHASHEGDFQDATRAVEYASLACSLTRWSNPEFLSTLDTAHRLPVLSAVD